MGDLLRREHAAGRLDTDEFADRYGRCLEAKTYAQLDALIADLPGAGEAAFEAGPAQLRDSAWRAAAWGAGAWRAGRRHWHVPALGWFALVLVLGGLSGGHLVWVAFPLFLFLVLRPLMWRSPSWRDSQGPMWGRQAGRGPLVCRSWHAGSWYAGPGQTV